MKALSVGLVKGSIDEVDKRVHMTWVQPRVLDLQQVPNVRAERAPSAGGDPRAVRGHGGNCSPSCCLETPRERGSGSPFPQPLPWGCAALGVCVLQWGVGDLADGAGIGDTSHPRATQTPETQPLGPPLPEAYCRRAAVRPKHLKQNLGVSGLWVVCPVVTETKELSCSSLSS